MELEALSRLGDPRHGARLPPWGRMGWWWQQREGPAPQVGRHLGQVVRHAQAGATPLCPLTAAGSSIPRQWWVPLRRAGAAPQGPPTPQCRSHPAAWHSLPHRLPAPAGVQALPPHPLPAPWGQLPHRHLPHLPPPRVPSGLGAGCGRCSRAGGGLQHGCQKGLKAAASAQSPVIPPAQLGVPSQTNGSGAPEVGRVPITLTDTPSQEGHHREHPTATSSSSSSSSPAPTQY